LDESNVFKTLTASLVPRGPLSLYDNSALERKLIWWPLHMDARGENIAIPAPSPLSPAGANRAWSCNQMWIKASQFIGWIWDMCRKIPKRTGTLVHYSGEPPVVLSPSRYVMECDYQHCYQWNVTRFDYC